MEAIPIMQSMKTARFEADDTAVEKYSEPFHPPRVRRALTFCNAAGLVNKLLTYDQDTNKLTFFLASATKFGSSS